MNIRATEPDPSAMATELLSGVLIGDMFVDNDWTEDFKLARGLLVARMRTLVDAVPTEPLQIEPPGDDERLELVTEYLGSEQSTGLEAEDSIVDHCVTYRCDFSDGDPLGGAPSSWSCS